MRIKKFLIYIKLAFLFLDVKKQGIKICDIKRWKKSFFLFLYNIKEKNFDYADRWKIIEGFTQSNIVKLKKGGKVENGDDPILISVVYNELERLEIFLNHYRKQGIKKFAILDNGSTDGTVQYLRRQRDVELFQTRDKFETRVKMGWINRLISYYGTDYWYLVVDADELLVWQGVETDCMARVVSILESKNMMRARALMVDMYPKILMWNSGDSFKEIFDQCKYFDCNTFYHKDVEEVYLLYGGARGRMLGMDVWLTKYPLFQLKEKEILSNPHSIYPYDNTKHPCYFALLHYKFLTGEDKQKMRKYARKGQYAGGSREYKEYVRKLRENEENFNFYYDESVEYTSSRSLSEIKEITDIITDDLD